LGTAGAPRIEFVLGCVAVAIVRHRSCLRFAPAASGVSAK